MSDLPKSLKRLTFESLILHEDDQIIVVNKPRGISSLADKSAKNIQLMGQNYASDLHLCHRLDKMTSGVMILAKGDENYRHVALQFQKRTIQKYYQTLVPGLQHYDRYLIDLPLLVTTNKRVAVHKQEGKSAQTYITSQEHFQSYTRLLCQPITGRMHQIRVHLTALRHPIIGDELYGGADLYLSQLKRNYTPSGRKEAERPLNHGFMLHAASIQFAHPRTEESLQIEAPFPKNFLVVLKMLRRYNSLS